MLALLLATALADDLHVDLLARTTVPIDIGARLQIELPERVRFGLHGGWMPPAYLDLTNTILVAANAYDESTAAMIEAGLDNAGLLGLDVGYRIHQGLVFDVGYQVAFLGGGFVAGEVAAAATGTQRVTFTEGEVLDVTSIVHMVTVDLGYEHVFDPGLVLRIDLGGAFTVASSTQAAFQARDGVFSSTLEGSSEDYLDETYRRYVHTPTVSFGLGYRFQ